MNRRDRRKQKKKQERQEQLRREKHLRPSPPSRQDEGEVETGKPAESQGPPPSAPTTPSYVTLLGTLPPGLGIGAAEAAGHSPDPTSASDPGGGASAGGSSEPPLDNYFVGEPARQWLETLLAGTDTYSIVQAIEPADYVPRELLLKASVCCEILVAAELVAAGRGRPSRHLPAPVAAWLLERDILFSPGVVAMAMAAVRRVGEFSELRHLWDTVHLGPEWLRGVEALIGRLSR